VHLLFCVCFLNSLLLPISRNVKQSPHKSKRTSGWGAFDGLKHMEGGVQDGIVGMLETEGACVDMRRIRQKLSAEV
jgi:hypothetical protein